MLFNSFEFLIFFPAVVFVYFALPARVRWVLLLGASYYFYMCWKAEYVLLIVASTLVDYLCGLRMASRPDRRARRPFLVLSLATNLGLLVAFKYSNFLNDSARTFFESIDIFYGVPAFDVLLPVGISFYTFQTLAYTIDVYRGKIQPERHLGYFALYVSFFPQLVAGPIERASHLLPQFRRNVTLDYGEVCSGLRQMVWGFFKKVVVADRLAVYVDAVYANPDEFSGLTLVLATYAFAFQIYCDFSGYSDIAIGAARVMGFDLMENFRRPYLAASIGEFWQRWHISLSTWFRDYLYIPLGGNRVIRWRHFFNLIAVFVISGFWHGANWTFGVWGLLHGGYLMLSIAGAPLRRRLVGALRLDPHGHLLRVVSVLITFHLVLAAWVFFRADSIADALLVFSRGWAGLGGHLSALVSLDFTTLNQTVIHCVGVTRVEAALCVALVLFVIASDLFLENARFEAITWRRRVLRLAWFDALVVITLLLGAYGPQQFLYFQF